ncbi:MAG: AAA-like domain protein [Syntrophorhabdus sp. PtaU1.Bin153]|nr:MAG: AAA-like domain protein [Syntrophorhabdus sp. PtaU1.Bin153]
MAEYLVERVENFQIWGGPENGQDTGIEYQDGYLYFSVFEVKGFPDLSLNLDLKKFDFQQRDKIVYTNQQKFIDTLHKIGSVNTSFSLRYVLFPEAAFESKIRLYFVVRVFSKEKDEKAFLHVTRQIPSVFPTEIGLYHAPVLITDEKTQKAALQGIADMQYMAEIRKKESIFIPYSGLTKLKYIYVPFNYAAQLNTMIQVCETLVKQSLAVILDINIIPTVLTAYEQHALKTLIINFEKLQREQKISVEPVDVKDDGELVEMPADPIVKIAFETYRNTLNEYASTGGFLMSCRVASQSVAAVESVITVMGRNSAKDFDYEIMSAHDSPDELGLAKRAFLQGNVSLTTYNNEIWDRPDSPAVLRRLHRLCGLSESGGFFKLPIPSTQGVPGFPITSRPENSVNEDGDGSTDWYAEHHSKAAMDSVIVLGNIGLRGEKLREELRITLKDLCKHGLVVGVPGSGKTTTCFHILYQLWITHKIPFLVIEPAKTEYRVLKTLRGMEDLLVFSLGDENCSPFRFNPFQVLPNVSIDKHISNLEACFRAALPLDGPLPFLLSEALERIYSDAGWQFTQIGSLNRKKWPMMVDLYQKLVEVIGQKGYSGEVLSNVRTALEVRVGGLLRRSVGRMLNTYLCIPPEILMSRPVVLELDSLNDEQQALITMFVLNMLKEYVKANRKSGTRLQHVVLLEEAHNLLGHVPIAQETGNPKAEAVKYFTKMLAEMRALGEGMIIADQLPSVLHSAVVKNTNLKIMHRLTSEDDRAQLGNTMLLDGEQFTRAVTLTPGEAYIYKEGLERPKHVFEPNFKDDFEISEPQDDLSVKASMKDFGSQNAAIYQPFVECSSYCGECDQNVRVRAERIMEGYASHTKALDQLLVKAVEAENRKCSCLYLLKLLLAKPQFLRGSREPKRMVFCLYVHFLHSMQNLVKDAARSTGCRCDQRHRQQVFEIFWIVNSRRLKGEEF